MPYDLRDPADTPFAVLDGEVKVLGRTVAHVCGWCHGVGRVQHEAWADVDMGDPDATWPLRRDGIPSTQRCPACHGRKHTLTAEGRELVEFARGWL